MLICVWKLGLLVVWKPWAPSTETIQSGIASLKEGLKAGGAANLADVLKGVTGKLNDGGKVEVKVPATVPTAPSNGVVWSPATGMAGEYGFNLKWALDRNNGALRHVVIAPGATWSFNNDIGGEDQLLTGSEVAELSTVGGHPGGGWCNLAARYRYSARTLMKEQGLSDDKIAAAIYSMDHNQALDIMPREDGITIFLDGVKNQDLRITNPFDKPLVMVAVEKDGELSVAAWLGK